MVLKEKRRILVVVPHQDDEINIAGSMLATLREKDIDVYVLYVTNGDYYPWMAKTRQNEAIEALKELRISSDKIVFLGYGDGWLSKKHIYNQEEETICVSHAQHSHTYSACGIPEYRYQKDRVHSNYTRKNYLNDLKSAIFDIHPDIILCNDFDCHYDHRAVSLFFDEAIHDLIVEKDYRPIVMKKFAYASVFDGEGDYYYNPFLPTLKPNKLKLIDPHYDTDVPAYGWKDRISLEVDKRIKTPFLRQSLLYKSAKKHYSQHMSYRLLRIINDDIVYWWRNTNGLQYKADICTSSGESKYLSDFKYVDCSDIQQSIHSIQIFDRCVWIPEEHDPLKKINISWTASQTVKQIVFYENFVPDSNILDMEISFDNGFVYHTGELKHDGSASCFSIPKQLNVRQMEVAIISYEGKRPGLTELEIYEDDQHFPYDDQILICYDDKKPLYMKRNKYLAIIDEVLVYSCFYIERFLKPDVIYQKIREKIYDWKCRTRS